MDKISFVAPQKGEISAAIIQSIPASILVSIDCGLQQIPQFSIRVPIDLEANLNAIQLVYLAVETVAYEILGFLLGSGIDPKSCQLMYMNILKALEKAEIKAGGNSDAERSGSADELLDRILEEEDDKLYEIDFDIPELFVDQVYDHIITASSNSYVRTQRVTPFKRDFLIEFTDHSNIKKTDPKAILRKYRNNVFKHTPSKNYILVYDITGKPVGVTEAPRGPIKWK